MNSDKVFDIIDAIAVTSSKNGKQDLIALNAGDEDFVRVLEAALNPFKTYGLAKRPVVTAHKNGLFDDSTWNILERLRTRNLTGNAAKDAVSQEMARLSSCSAELFWRIISKDLKAGFSESTVNKAVPRTVPTFDCMLAHKFEPDRIKEWPQVAEPKLDGVRVLAFVDIDDQSVGFFSRSGKEFLTFEHLKGPLLDMVSDYRADLMASASDEYDTLGLPDGEETRLDVLDNLYEKHGVEEALSLVLDGEIVSGSFNNTVSEVRRKDSQATDAMFNVFDILPASLFKEDDKVPSELGYSDRRKQLEMMVGKSEGPVVLLPRYLVNSVAEIHALYERVRGRGLEGLIVKSPKAPYHRRRNHAWMKIKAEESVDVRIVDVVEGTSKYEGMLGALVIDHEGVQVNVGSGLSDAQRQSFWENSVDLIGRLIEVEYHEITPDGSLRHPRFKRFRDDKA